MDTTGKRNKGFVCIGDTHGNFQYIRDRIKRLNITDMTLLHVGDFGVGFKEEEKDRYDLTELNMVLRDNNCMMYVIRGNHDNPEYFDGTWKWSNLKLVPDYTVVNVDGDDILMVGGATSIDRIPRKLREEQLKKVGAKWTKLHYSDENFKLDEERLKEVKGVRYVVTHCAPHFCEPINNVGLPTHGYVVEGFAEEDKNLKTELDEERMQLTKMYEILKENNFISAWFYGHFHRSHAMYYEDTDFVLLGINEFREVR